MPSIVIRLDPAKLKNADADLRYEIPDLLAERSSGLIEDDGYDYEEGSSAMHIYLWTSDLNSAVPQVVAFLERESLHENRLADAAQLGVSEVDASATSKFRVVYPPDATGFILPREL